ncbi:hypothetical protein [Halobacteriovorax sp. JY17]|uniref:hypothetical protein n=1 Tax=Halobacteriovorax sp. JY17 TaxID=2014617 RepID=UPI000C434277|nr:hypothetical protein [Halobacteriovorax sp. JY17]PIK13514.1 MAG: hypothetical protein CES88_16475 [Halobacteriovorax sp. JY17]
MKTIKKKILDISKYFTTVSFILMGSLLLPSGNVYAFTKLKNGFETITNNYLIPLSNAVAGAALILFVILSYFKQDVYLPKVGTIFALAIISYVGLEIISTLSQSFS